MFRTMVPSLGLLASGVGCSEWPRFSHPPPAPTDPFDRIAVSGQLVEPAEPGWPDSPANLELPADSPAFGEPLYAVDIRGSANTVSHLLGGSVPFDDCPNLVADSPVGNF